MMKIQTIVVLFVLITNILGQKHNVTQVTNSEALLKSFQSQQFTLLYIYSSSCAYCQQFTPLYEKLSSQIFFREKEVQFIKIDEHLFKPQLQKYGVFSFPTVLLFWKDYPQNPILFKEERNQSNIKAFIQHNTRVNQHKIPAISQMSPYQRMQEKVVVYYGSQQNKLYKALGLAGNRDKFFSWSLVPIKQNEEQKVVVGNKQLIGSDLSLQQIQTTIKKVFARVFTLGEEPWVKIFLNKQLGIVHVNPENNSKLSKLLKELAKQYQNLVFMELTPQHPEYKSALKTFGMVDQQNIIAVDRRAEAVFAADTPYTKQSLEGFIQKVKKYEWPLYKKTEKTVKQEKLTRQNYNQKINTKQDVVLFLYKRQDKISKSLMNLFTHLRTKLSENKNILFLRCDVSSNEIEQYLGFSLQKTPKLVFFRDRMKDKPIHFYGSKISEESVIQFIMENTTFDWKDQWYEL